MKSGMADEFDYAGMCGGADSGCTPAFAATRTGATVADALTPALETIREGIVNVYPENTGRPYQLEHYEQVRRESLAALALVEETIQAARAFEEAVRIFDVMLNEPAAKGLMSAEDYETYYRGAWLGVDEAAVALREKLAALDGGE